MAKTENLLSPDSARDGGEQKRLRGGFINTGAASCSIYESGLMVYDCIRESSLYSMDYFALTDFDVAAFARDGKIRPLVDGAPSEAQPVGDYDFWVFNWHFITMAMHLSPDAIKVLPGRKFTVVLELSPGDPLKLVPTGVFDGYIALDPAAPLSDGIFPFPRPLQGVARRPKPSGRKVPIIGSFGFGTPGKGFEQLIEAVNNEFDQAVVRVNVPSGTYIGTDVVHRGNYARHLEAVCKRIAKPGIDVHFTFDFMGADELVDWCEGNDLNCFMYTRCQPGLSATTDQAIMSGRPLATLTNDTFRHIHQYIPPYPVISLREAIEASTPHVYAMQEDWSRASFNRTFHHMIASFGLKAPEARPGQVTAKPAAVRSRILVAHRDGADAGDPVDYAARTADCLGRTGEFEVVRVRCSDLAEVKALTHHLQPFGLVLLDFDTVEPGQIAAALRDFAGPKIIIAQDDSIARLKGVENNGRCAVLPRRPVVPFFTVQVARQEPPVICLVGFSGEASNLEKVLAGIAKEFPRASIQIEAPTHKRTELEQRLEDIRRRAGQPRVAQVSIISLPGNAEDMVNLFAAHTLVLVYNDPARSAELEGIACLAMTTERAVVFTRAAPFAQFSGLEIYFEDCSVRDAIAMGIAAQIRVRHAYGEWRLFADLRKHITDDSSVSERMRQIVEAEPYTASLSARTGAASVVAVTADEILALKGAAFVRAAYNAVLNREPDPDGLRHYLDLLRKGVRRHTILATLRLSPEGRRRASDFPGLDVVLRRHRMLSARAFGKLAQLWNSAKGRSGAPAARFEDALRVEEQLEFGAEERGLDAVFASSTTPVGMTSSHIIKTRKAQFAVGVNMFLLAGIEGTANRPAKFLSRLESALAPGGDVSLVVWSSDDKHFRLATSSELRQLGLPPRDSEPEDDVAVILDPSSARGGWLLAGDREYADPDEPGLLELNMILEARRLGLRSAFIFRGAEPLKQRHLAGPIAESYEMYMQALLLADIIMPVSKLAEDDLNDFFVQHQFADFIPTIRKAPLPAEVEGDEEAGWREYARRVRSLLSDVVDAAAALGAVYYWAGAPGCRPADLTFADSLARALSARGVVVIPVDWSVPQGALVPAVAAGASAWVEPGEPDAPRWILAPSGVHTDLLADVRVFVQTRGLRFAAILQEEAGPSNTSHSRTVFDGLIFADKVLAVSPGLHHAFFRHILATRAKVPRAEHRYRMISRPDEIVGRPRAVVPKVMEPGIVRILVSVRHANDDIANILEALFNVSERSQDRLLVTFIGVGEMLPKGDILSTRPGAAFGLRWELDATPERTAQLLDQADFVVMPNGLEHSGELVHQCHWRGLPYLLHQCQFDVKRTGAIGHDQVDMHDLEALTEAVLKLTDPMWRRCLSHEAISRPVRSWDAYARDIAVELATDRLTDGLQRPSTEARGDIYTRMTNLRKRPKLSICISTYNRAGWVQTNLRNIFSQLPAPVDDLEVLVVDNTSPDNTPEVVQPYLHRSDFRYIRNPKNVGMLGNLAVTAQRARGEHIWIIGDDDLTRVGVIDKILGLLRQRPGLPLIYMNYGYSTEEFPLSITDLDAFLNGYNILEPPGPDVEGTGKSIAAKCENFYTAIYSHVYRRDHGLRAYSQDTSGRTFATMLSCIPTAYYVLHYMSNLPAYWIGEPSLVVNSRVSWAAYGPMLDLEHLPASWDLAERAGCPPEEVERRRANRLWLVKMMWRDLFENDTVGNADYIDPPTVLMRLNHLPEMKDHIGELIDVYTRAHDAGHKGAKMSPEILFAGWT